VLDPNRGIIDSLAGGVENVTGERDANLTVRTPDAVANGTNPRVHLKAMRPCSIPIYLAVIS